MGAILTKMAILRFVETNHTWLQNFAWGDLTKNENRKKENYVFYLLGLKD